MLKLFRRKIRYISTNDFELAKKLVVAGKVDLAIIGIIPDIDLLLSQKDSEFFEEDLRRAFRTVDMADVMVPEHWLDLIVQDISGGLPRYFTQGCPGHRYRIAKEYAAVIGIQLANRNHMVAVE